MSSGPSVAVIGAGAAGLSTAMLLARQGARSVTVLEKTHLAEASSGLSAGIFNRQTFDDIDLTMRIDSGDIFDDLETQGLLTLHRTGYIRLARTEAQWDRVRSAVESGSALHSQLLTPSDLEGAVPGLRVDDVVGGMFGPRDGHVDGPDLCRAYLRAGQSHGVVYRPNAAVVGRRDRPGIIVLETTAGDIEADVVVNAAGAWLQEVGDILGCPAPIANQRHHVGLVRVPSLASRPLPVVQTYFPGSDGNAVYVRPEGDGQLLSGLHSYEMHEPAADPDHYGRAVESGYLEALAERLHHRFPGWEDASLRPGWTGLYPLSPDGRFIIGPDSRDARVVTIGGLGGVGLTVSPAAGRLAAEWAAIGEATSYDFAEQLLPSRFARTGNHAR